MPAGPGWVEWGSAQALGTGGWWDGPRRGVVVAFDSARGLGEVRAEGPGVISVAPFHCTALADGSREVPVGARVCFGLRPGHHGRLEATGLVVLDPTPAEGTR